MKRKIPYKKYNLPQISKFLNFNIGTYIPFKNSSKSNSLILKEYLLSTNDFKLMVTENKFDSDFNISLDKQNHRNILNQQIKVLLQQIDKL